MTSHVEGKRENKPFFQHYKTNNLKTGLMNRDRWLSLCSLLFACIVLFISWPTSAVHMMRQSPSFESPPPPPKAQGSLRVLSSYPVVQQRNVLSRELNKLQEKYGQLQCAQQGNKKVSSTGGWCSKERKLHHAFDKKMARALDTFLKDKTVASFGDGPGDYRDYINKSGKVKTYDAFDGAPFCYNNTKGSVHFLDLTLDQFGLPAYDWVVSLEVIEHIPRQYEHIVLSNIVRHAREGIILSWAKVGQGGFYHVNNRNLEYVLQTLAVLGFKRDEKASKFLSTSASLSWLRANTNAYRRQQTTPLLETEL